MSIEADNVIIGIIVGSLIATAFVLALILYIVRLWIRGPMKGSDNRRRLDGRIVAITGASSGIGLAVTRDLYRRGAEVVMLCRNLPKAEKAADKIEKGARYMDICDRGYLRIIHCDLASIESIKNCAQQLYQCYDRIDFLVNNAGVMMCPESKTSDEFDLQFGINHLGHFLLTELLTPLLAKSGLTGFQPRIVVVSSTDHIRGEINWDDVNFKLVSKTLPYDPAKAYYQSKLANLMHANELTTKLQGTGISVYSVHPGATHTDLYRDVMFEWYGCFLYLFLVCFAKTPREGAQTILFCLLDESLDEITGGFYKECRAVESSVRSTNPTDCQKLWILSEKLLNLRSCQSEML